MLWLTCKAQRMYFESSLSLWASSIHPLCLFITEAKPTAKTGCFWRVFQCPAMCSGYQASTVVQNPWSITQLSVLYTHLKGKAHVHSIHCAKRTLAITQGHSGVHDAQRSRAVGLIWLVLEQSIWPNKCRPKSRGVGLPDTLWWVPWDEVSVIAVRTWPSLWVKELSVLVICIHTD